MKQVLLEIGDLIKIAGKGTFEILEVRRGGILVRDFNGSVEYGYVRAYLEFPRKVR